VPSTILDLAKGKDAAGQPVIIQNELLELVTPLIIQDTYSAMKEDGIKALFTVGIPAAFGIGVQTYKPSAAKPKTFKIYHEDRITESTPEQYQQMLKRKEEIQNEKLDLFKKSGVGFDKYGQITIDDTKWDFKKNYQNLSDEEKKDLEQSVSARASAEAKSEFQPFYRKPTESVMSARKRILEGKLNRLKQK
jgi:hypothetical protein